MLGATTAIALLAFAGAPENTDRFTPGVAASVGVGIGIIHRHGAPFDGVFLDSFPGAVPAGELRLAVDGVPKARPTLSIGGDVQWRTSTLNPMEVRVGGVEPRTVHARTMAGTATLGLTWWPRRLAHRLGIGGEAGYAVAPLWIRDDVALAPYALHGPLARGRLEAWSRRGRVQLLARSGIGAMVPTGLENAHMTRPGPSVNVALDLVVRIEGPVHLYGHAQLWYAFMSRGSMRRFDDHGVPFIVGLLLRTPRAG